MENSIIQFIVQTLHISTTKSIEFNSYINKLLQSVNKDAGSSCNDILQKNLIIIIYKAYPVFLGTFILKRTSLLGKYINSKTMSYFTNWWTLEATLGVMILWIIQTGWRPMLACQIETPHLIGSRRFGLRSFDKSNVKGSVS